MYVRYQMNEFLWNFESIEMNVLIDSMEDNLPENVRRRDFGRLVCQLSLDENMA